MHLTGSVPAEYDLLKKYCNGWRNFNDIAAAYDSVRGIITFWANEPPQTGWNYSAFQAAAGPGSQNDPDMLMVGGTVRRQDAAGVWVAFFQECQEYRWAGAVARAVAAADGAVVGLVRAAAHEQRVRPKPQPPTRSRWIVHD